MKKIIPILIVVLIAFSCNTKKDSSDEQNYKVWNNCNELIEFIQYSNFKGISSTFGENIIGEPWDGNAGVGTPKMLVEVTFPEVTLNGKVLKLNFENSYYSLEDMFHKNPTKFYSISCSDYQNIDAKTEESVSEVILQETSNTESEWSSFRQKFIDAVNKKNTEEVNKLSLQNDEFYGGGGGTALDYFFEDEIWERTIQSLQTGFVDYENFSDFNNGTKITNDQRLIFVYSDNKWNWYGVMGD